MSYCTTVVSRSSLCRIKLSSSQAPRWWHTRLFSLRVAVALLLILGGYFEEVTAEQFRYFDSAGSLHFETKWQDIPKEYRGEAAQNYYRSPQNHFTKQRATESLFDGPTYVPLRPPAVSRGGGLRRVWRPRGGGYSGIQTTRIQ
jgi:hypothetical protein